MERNKCGEKAMELTGIVRGYNNVTDYIKGIEYEMRFCIIIYCVVIKFCFVYALKLGIINNEYKLGMNYFFSKNVRDRSQFFF